MELEKIYLLYLNSRKVSTDTRALEKRSIYFSLRGENFDGNRFAKAALDMGACAAVVDDPFYKGKDGYIFVKDVLKTLQQLALYHRSKLDIPIIALTGSNGKTTTKELIHSVLSQKFRVLSTKGNLNNHIGVPLTILSIQTEHQIAVIEIGANHPGEIKLLSNICAPEIGYVTNFGKAHLEGFGSEKGVIKAKSELYDNLKNNNKTVLVNVDDPIQLEKTKTIRSLKFGSSKSSDFTFFPFEKGNKVGISYQNVNILSQLSGLYNYSNLCAAATLGLFFKIPLKKIKLAIESYEPSNMRSQLIRLSQRTLLIDTYNANPSSMIASLINFSKFEGTKAVILGDMFELGERSSYEHQNILNLIATLHFHEVFLIGEQFHELKNLGFNSYQFISALDFISFLSKHGIHSKNILIKGSRKMKLEKIVDKLKEMF